MLFNVREASVAECDIWAYAHASDSDEETIDQLRERYHKLAKQTAQFEKEATEVQTLRDRVRSLETVNKGLRKNNENYSNQLKKYEKLEAQVITLMLRNEEIAMSFSQFTLIFM